MIASRKNKHVLHMLCNREVKAELIEMGLKYPIYFFAEISSIILVVAR